MPGARHLGESRDSRLRPLTVFPGLAGRAATESTGSAQAWAGVDIVMVQFRRKAAP